MLIVTAAMGAGHTAVASELARRLTGRDCVPTVVDVLGAAGAAGDRLRTTYRRLLDHAPWLYGGAMAVWERCPQLLETFTGLNARPFDEAIAAAVAEHRPDVIVCTYNLAAQRTGRLVARGVVDVPVVTFVVDPGAHPYWVSRDVDLHLALTPATAAALLRFGAPTTATVAPVLRPEFTGAPDRAAARARLDLPPDARIVLVNAGSWAVGGIEATVDALAGRDVLPLVLCGRDADLAARLRATGRGRVVEWTPDMPALLAAADVVVDNAGGQTCWESLACRTPVVLYRPLPGHGVRNAHMLECTGLAAWARTPAQLVQLVDAPPARPGQAPELPRRDAVDAILAVVDRAAERAA